MMVEKHDGVVGVGRRKGKTVLGVVFNGEYRYMTVTEDRASEELAKGRPIFRDPKWSVM